MFHTAHPRPRPGRPSAAAAGLLAALAAAGVSGWAGVAGATPASAGHDNGVTSMSPAAALKAAAAAVRSERNLVITGNIALDGASVSLDVASAGGGTMATGQLRAATAGPGFAGTLRFVTLPGAAYLWAGRAFWATELAKEPSISASERARLVGALTNRWIALPASGASQLTSGLGVITNPAKLATELTTASGTLAEGTVRQIGTVQALPVDTASGGRIWIETTGKPLPVEVTGTTGSTVKGQLYLRYPAALSISAPKGAVTLSQLGLGA
jgi:hypothetical protein